jgi:hypothetical protein
MFKTSRAGIAVLLSCAVLSFVADTAKAQDAPFRDTNAYASCQSRFAVIFPGAPTARDVTYTTAAGTSVPARQFSLERGSDRFAVTVVELPGGPALDEQIIDHAADVLRKRGDIRMQFSVGYIAGVRGRQLLISEPNGQQLRGSVYMHDHRIYITEVSSGVGDSTALQFDQSITIIDGEGIDVDRGQTNTPQRVFTCR